MEYEGAGSFWAQLASGQGGEVMFMSRKIDELLKDQTSSLIDILSDDEVISEFRSANPKLVSRIVDSEGLKMIVNLVTYHDLPATLSTVQRLQLPFIASELVACEVDQLLDAFVRSVPGHRTPIDRLFDFIIEGTCRDPTILGYVSRVLSIVISRRASSVDKYISESQEAVHHAFYDMCFDHSVCDLVIKLLIEDDVRIFPSQFSLFTLVSRNRFKNNTGLYVLDNVLNRPGVMHDRIVQIFHKLEKEGRDELVPTLIDSALTDRDIGSMDILSLLIAFCFKYSSFSEMSTPHWESFVPQKLPPSITQPPLPFAGGQDDDSCVFDDEEPKDLGPTQPLPRFASTPFTDFGYYMVDNLAIAISENSDGLVEEYMDSITHLVSFLRLISRVVVYSSGAPKIAPDFVAKICLDSMMKFPHSSAIHNLARESLTCSAWTSGQLQSLARCIVPRTVKFVEVTSSSSGGCFGYMCRILHHLTNVLGPDYMVENFSEDADMVLAASKKWIGEINVKLSTFGTSSMTSPRTAGSIPIVDMDVPPEPTLKGESAICRIVLEEETEPWSAHQMVRSNPSLSDDDDDNDDEENKNPE